MAVKDNYILLLQKLDEFIRKFYKNQLIRGGLWFVGVFAVFFLIVSVLEYYARFGTVARTVIFYLYLVINLFILMGLVIVPLFRLFRIGKVISHEQAAAIIGKHFPEVSDKLLNTLQLKEIEGKEKGADDVLIRASIDQKIERLKPVPFKAAIDLKQNRRYLRYVVPPVALIILIFFTAPRVITEPTTRLVKHSEFFEEPLPFRLEVMNEKMEAIQREDFVLDVRATGDVLPAEVYIEADNYTYKLRRKGTGSFEYVFKSLQADKKFVLTADKYRSDEYLIRVLPKPIVLNFDVTLDFPPYTGKPDETIENTGDLVIPQGTTATWRFYTRDTKKITFLLEETNRDLSNEASNVFTFTHRFMRSGVYSIIPSNEYVKSRSDSISYSVSVIPDAYPSIEAEQAQDSVFDKRIYFRGTIKDDYGFSRLTFNLSRINQEKNEVVVEQVYDLPVSKTLPQQQFFHFANLDSMGVEPGDQVVYHFEVWDNDGVNGPKKSRSNDMIFRVPTREEVDEKMDKENDRMEEELQQSIKDARELQKKIDELNRKLLEKENIGWQERQQVQDLISQQQQLQERVERIQKENERKNLQEQQYKSVDEELVRKQELLQKLMEDVLSDEMKKMLEEMQNLLEEIDKDKINEMLDQMKMDNKSIEKELDRNLELFKQLEFEKKLQDAIDKLKELAKKQEELANKTEEEKDDQGSLSEEQKKMNEEFEKFRKEMEELHSKNEELEQPNNIEKTEQQEEEIENDMDQGLDELNKGNNKGASSSQKKAAGKMQKLSDKLSQMQSDMYMEELGEDIGDLREILENLLQLSFDQEGLIERTIETSTLDPQYVGVIETQKRISDDLVMVEDSLYALSKRQPMIESYVTKEITSINENVAIALDKLNDRQKSVALEGQQYAMTSINNLALMLSEILEQMMMNASMQASGQCKKGMPKPGGGKSSMKSMRQLQQQLNKQMEEMKNQMGKSGEGQKQEPRGSSMSKEMVKMASQQEAIRRMMEQYAEEMKSQGELKGNELNDIMDKMEQTETEIVNKMITQQTIERLKDIETRLLKHEKAELQREQEEKRESREAKSENYGNPAQFLEYNRLKSKEVELLKTIPPQLKPFYKNKVNDYFYNVELE